MIIETKTPQQSPMKALENTTDFEGPRTRKKFAELKQKPANKTVTSPIDNAQDSIAEQLKEELEDKSRIPTLEPDGQFLMSISSGTFVFFSYILL